MAVLTFGGVACICGAYLLGAVPFGLLLGRARGIDVRKSGSGNIGATNLSRSLGRGWGIVAFLLDFAKGLLPVLLARTLVSEWPSGSLDASPAELANTGLASTSVQNAAWLPAAAGAAAVLGHVFPIYLRFRGGKGVATAFGAMAALSPPAALAGGAVWGAVFLTTKTVSLGSLAAAATLPVVVALCAGQDAPPADVSYVSVQVLAIFLTVLVFARHRGNIVRLFNGEEFRFRSHKANE